MHQIVKLHSKQLPRKCFGHGPQFSVPGMRTLDGGLVGADKVPGLKCEQPGFSLVDSATPALAAHLAVSQALQEEIDSAVLMLLSYLAHLGEVQVQVTASAARGCRFPSRMSRTQPSLRRQRSSPSCTMPWPYS